MHQNNKAAVNDELERIIKEEIMTYFRISFQDLPGSVTKTITTLTNLSVSLGFNI
jgi:hypothetical protein